MFTLINIIITIILAYIGIKIILGLYSLAVVLPSIAVAIRRLHDIGKSGWWILIGLIPIIGWLVILYFYVLDGNKGNNTYGPDPKNVVTQTTTATEQTPTQETTTTPPQDSV